MSQRSLPWLRWYPDEIPLDLEIPDAPLTSLLDGAAARHPRRTALVFHGRRVRYRTLLDRVDRFATGLRRLGVSPGDRVALVLPNCPQFVIAFYGVLRAGGVAVPHNPLQTARELADQLTDCGARVAVVLDHSYAALREARRTAPLEHVVVTSLVDHLPLPHRAVLRLPLLQTQRLRARLTAEVPADPGLVDFRGLLAAPPWRGRPVPLDPARQPAAILYAGGSEDRVRGAVLTHRNLLANARQSAAWDTGGRDGREVTLAVVPLFHSFGLTLCLNASVLRAGTVVLVPRFGRDRVIRAIRRYRVTVFPGVPTLYDQILRAPRLRRSDLRSLRISVSGAMPLGRETIERFGRLGAGTLVQGYGLTEAGPCVACNPLDGNARGSTVGLPLPLTHAVVVDEDRPTRILPPGRPGELVVRGPQVFQGYWNRPLATAQVLSKGWLRTGDVAVMSPDGYVTILERRPDMIKVSGFSVYPTEVEEVLRRHPAVLDCAVIGLPDDLRGERVAACTVVHPAYLFSAEELRRHCAKYLSHYKVPQEMIQRTALPRSLSGRPLRELLREEYVPGRALA